MTDSFIRFEKRSSALPETLTSNTLYFVKTSPTTADMYMSDNTGSTAVKVGGGGSDEIDPFLLMGVTHE